MFKNFHGFHLLESYTQWKKEHRARKNPIGVRALKVMFAVLVTLLLWFIPASGYGLEGINAVEQRVIAVFAFAALMWFMDAVPA